MRNEPANPSKGQVLEVCKRNDAPLISSCRARWQTGVRGAERTALRVHAGALPLLRRILCRRGEFSLNSPPGGRCAVKAAEAAADTRLRELRASPELELLLQ